jgi:hypothetical protein
MIDSPHDAVFGFALPDCPPQDAKSAKNCGL